MNTQESLIKLCSDSPDLEIVNLEQDRDKGKIFCILSNMSHFYYKNEQISIDLISSSQIQLW